MHTGGTWGLKLTKGAGLTLPGLGTAHSGQALSRRGSGRVVSLTASAMAKHSFYLAEHLSLNLCHLNVHMMSL